jgi:hypothetical protein
MSVILLVLGILLTGAGVVVVGFAVPIHESGIGQTLIISGAVAIVGGPLLVGLGVAVSQLAQIAAALKVRPANRTGRVAAAVQRAEEIFPDPDAAEVRPAEARSAETRPTETRPVEARSVEARIGSSRPVDMRLPELGVADPMAVEVAATPNQTVAASASAIERLRATMGRTPPAPDDADAVPFAPNGAQHPTAPAIENPQAEAAPRAPAPKAPAPKAPELVARAAAPADNAAKEPKLDFLFRPRPARPPQPESFDALWPKRSARLAPDPARMEEVETLTIEASPASVEERRLAPVEERRVPPPRIVSSQPEEARPSVAILKSGVVDGMAYTLYADGSIEAQLPQGTVRFGSIAELRTHIETNS